MTIGEKIIGECVLSIDEAETVYHSIQELHAKGRWNIPGWACELQEHLQVISCAHPSIISMTWRALAIAYRQGCPTL